MRQKKAYTTQEVFERLEKANIARAFSTAVRKDDQKEMDRLLAMVGLKASDAGWIDL